MFLSPSTVCYTSAIAISIALVLGSAGCGGAIPPFEPVQTRAIGFQADSVINNDQALEIDIIYITYVGELREVTRLGPTAWFKAEKRSQWKFKESFIIKGGQKAMVELDPLILKRTVLLVVYANYANTPDPTDKQVIVDYAGQNKEIIFVKQSNLEPKRRSLRYVK